MTDANSPGPCARVYYELPLSGPDDWIRALDITLQYGGYLATDNPGLFRASIYLRASLDAPDGPLLWRAACDTSPWSTATLKLSNSVSGMRCVVVRLEATGADITWPDAATSRSFNDQLSQSDVPPFGVQVLNATVFATALGRDVTGATVSTDILGRAGLTADASLPGSGMVATQLAYTVPTSNDAAAGVLNAASGTCYTVSYDGVASYYARGSGRAWSYAEDDPRTVWSLSETGDNAVDGVVVTWQDAAGTTQQTLVGAASGTIAQVAAPTGVTISEAMAQQMGYYYLADHPAVAYSGSLTIHDPEALQMRPGDTVNGQHVSGVTLHPLTLSVDAHFGSRTDRFDLFIAELAGGAQYT